MTTSDRVHHEALTRDEALHILRAHQVELRERFGVTELALFGSTVRNEARPDSDVDILVAYDELPDWISYFSVQPYLEELLGRPVDVCTSMELRDEMRARVEAEAVRV